MSRDQVIDGFNRAGRFQIDRGGLVLDGVEVGDLNLSHAADDAVEVSRIEIDKPYRGLGYARGAMKQLLEVTDALGLTVALSPSGDWGASKERLTRFYASLGFVKNQGRNKDFRFRATMYREPRVAARAREMREDGRPDCRGPINDWTWYHGSWNRFDSFRSERRHTFGRDPSMTPIFLTCERDTARAHAGPRGWIYTVEVVGAQPFTSESIFADGWPKWWPPTAEQLTPIGRELLRDLETGRIFADATRGGMLRRVSAIYCAISLRRDGVERDEGVACRARVQCVLRARDASRPRAQPGGYAGIRARFESFTPNPSVSRALAR